MIGRVVRGLGALLVLVGLLAGLPAALWFFGGHPLEGWPSLDQWSQGLTSPDDGTLLLALVKAVGWAGWAVFALSTVVETGAAARKVKAPRLPALGVPQALVRALVGAVVAMTAVTGTAATADAGVEIVQPGDTLSGIAAEHLGDGNQWPTLAEANPHLGEDPDLIHPGQEITIPEPPAQAEEGEGSDGPGTVVVQPGDTLSGIAAEHLGDGNQWPTLAEANPQITDADLIFPGQEVTIPGDQPAAKPAEPTPGQGEEPAPPIDNTPTEVGAAVTGALDMVGDTVPPAVQAAGEALGAAVTTVDTPEAAEQGAGEPTTTGADAAEAAPAGETDDGQESSTRQAIGIAALSAAGILGLLGAARAAQSRRRRPGRRISMPTGPAAGMEATLRSDCDDLAVADLDRALRTLAHWAHTTNTLMPEVRAARVTAHEIELYLAADSTAGLPEPFTATDEPGTWVLDREGTAYLLDAEKSGEVPAPYPTLVTLGQDPQDGWVLLNLEQVGALGITGTPDDARAVLAALVLELVGSSWADDLRVTLVGVMPDLAAALQSDRVEHADTLEDVLPGLAFASDVHTRTLTAVGHETVTTARAAHTATETWTPHLLVLATDPTPEQATQLTQLLTGTPRIAVATLSTTQALLSEWTLTLTGQQAHLSPGGVQLVPQRIPATDYAALIEAFTTTLNADTPGPAWAQTLTPEPALDQIPTPDAVTETDSTVDVGVQGDQAQIETPSAGDLVTSAEAQEDLVDTSEGTGKVDEDTTNVDASRAAEALDGPVSDEPGPEVTQGHQEAPQPQEEAPAGTAVAPVAGAPATDDAQDPLDELEEEDAVVRVLTRPGPKLRLLGPVQIQDTTGKRPQSPGRITELIVHLALHPAPTPDALDAALWPGKRVKAASRNVPVSQARSWLGTTTDGQPYLPYIDEGGYRLHPDLESDWAAFNDLIGEDISTATTANLVAALRLVDGQPLTVQDRYYAWAEADKQEMIAAIADVSHEVSARALTSGDARTAAWAAAKGTTADPSSETLWRDQLRAAWLSAIPGQVQRIADQMSATLDAIGGDLEPDTVELLDQLLNPTSTRLAHG